MGIDNIGFFSLAYSLTHNLNELRTEFYKSRQTNKNHYVIASDVCCMLCTSSCLRVGGFPPVQGSKGMGDFKKNHTIIYRDVR